LRLWIHESTIGSTRPRLGAPVHCSMEMPRPATPLNVVTAGNQQKRAWKDQGPNWNPLEVGALIHAKR